MNAKKCLISVSAIAIAVSGVIKAKSLNYSATTYSVCSNPGLFSADYGIDKSKYETIYLGYCSERGNNISIAPAKKDKSNNNTTTIVSIPKSDNPTATQKPKATATPKPQNTPVPTKECKNKNSGKDGSPSECNAGKGNG